MAPAAKGYAGILCPDEVDTSTIDLPLIHGVKGLDYLSEGDVVALRPSGRVNVLYRRAGRPNTILMTERCNSLCLMCSQPPKASDDSYRVAEILRLIELIDTGCPEVILSGGEPTLLGESLFRIVATFAELLPHTAVHILTNGRRFKERELACGLADIRHPDLMLGIPLYSDVSTRHAYVVQAQGAFEETVLGLYNLARFGNRVEIRVVLHKQTYERLPQLAEFIFRNLPFVEHVALMGLEMFGFTHQNLDVLWIDPVDYQEQLTVATLMLAERGMNVSIYNHQLCTIPISLWPFARKSISDWKNVYLGACTRCGVRRYCGGFFESAVKRHSAHIAPFPDLGPAAAEFMDRLHASSSMARPAL
jgi:His-Xaa-Ser system radical SAM maturase HxsC